MRYITYLAPIMLAASCSLAQTRAPQYEWRATLKVVDETGSPVSGANAGVGYFTNSIGTSIDGITDTNGMFSVSHSSLSSLAEVSMEASKAGYYSTRGRRDLGPKYDPAQWIFTQTLVLKKIGHPVPMYAKAVNLGMPVFDKPAGFDFTAGDWVAPYGKGLNADIIFNAQLVQRAKNDAEYKLTVSFPGPGDGIQEFTMPEADRGTGFHSPHEAPASGYQSQWIQTRSRKPGQPETGNRDANRNYFIRVRTTLDQNGKVVSANYGKMYGDFLQFRYYLNPTINDRNIEFDPNHNLLIGVKSFERVSEP